VKNMIIDAHQHLWVKSEREYSWITPELKELDKDFTPEDFLEASTTCKIDGTVLVQAADTYEDTSYMLEVAHKYSFVKGIVAWVPFDRTFEARAAIETLSSNRIVKGFRNLTHDYSNAKYESDDYWITRSAVIETLQYIAERKFTLDFVAVNANHLNQVIRVAEMVPDLNIMIDHLGKPDIANAAIAEWAQIIKKASELGNIYLKVSGLNTASKKDWKVTDWKPYFEVAYDNFGADRLVLGGDWPVIELSDSFEKVWSSQLELISHLSDLERAKISGLNAAKFYKLEE